MYNPLLEMIEGMVELKRLEDRGALESPAADVVRDRMDKPWRDMTEYEHAILADFCAAMRMREEGEGQS